MIRSFCNLPIFVLLSALAVSQSPSADHSPIMLPTSKMLTVPSPGRLGSTNSFPATMVVSPDGRFAAALDDGYGTQETLAQQSISVLDLKTNQIVDYPDARLGERIASELFSWVGIQFGRQAPVCLRRFAKRPHRRGIRQHRKRNRSLWFFRR